MTPPPYRGRPTGISTRPGRGGAGAAHLEDATVSAAGVQRPLRRVRPHRPQRHGQPEHRQVLTCRPAPATLSPPAPGQAWLAEKLQRYARLLASPKNDAEAFEAGRPLQRECRDACGAEACTLHVSLLTAADSSTKLSPVDPVAEWKGRGARLFRSGRRARSGPASRRPRSHRLWRPLPPTSPSPPGSGRTRSGRTLRSCAPATTPQLGQNEVVHSGPLWLTVVAEGKQGIPFSNRPCICLPSSRLSFGRGHPCPHKDQKNCA